MAEETALERLLTVECELRALEARTPGTAVRTVRRRERELRRLLAERASLQAELARARRLNGG